MGFVEADGVNIAYQRVGEGPLVVFVHGAAQDGRSWQPQLDGLADEFTVVAWDEPGAGLSGDPPEGYALRDFVDGLAVRVEGARQMLTAPEVDFDPTLPGLFAADPPTHLVPLLAAVAADVRPGTLGRDLAIMAETDLSDLLPRITVPTLLIWGALDARSPLTVAAQFEQAIPAGSTNRFRLELPALDPDGACSSPERAAPGPSERRVCLLPGSAAQGRSSARKASTCRANSSGTTWSATCCWPASTTRR